MIRRSLGFAYLALGRVDQDAGQLDRARGRAEQALTLLEQFGDRRAVALALADLGSTATAQRDFASAYHHLVLSLRTQEEIGDIVGIAMVQDRFAALAAAQGQAAVHSGWAERRQHCAIRPDRAFRRSCRGSWMSSSSGCVGRWGRWPTRPSLPGERYRAKRRSRSPGNDSVLAGRRKAIEARRC